VKTRSISNADVATRIHERIMRDPVASEGYSAERELVELGRSLREARQQLRATQAQIAKKAGMTQGELSRLENGLLPQGVMYTTLAQLCRVLGRQVVLQR
jgi:DNA-binding XRE family transcriptional regulator